MAITFAAFAAGVLIVARRGVTVNVTQTNANHAQAGPGAAQRVGGGIDGGRLVMRLMLALLALVVLAALAQAAIDGVAGLFAPPVSAPVEVPAAMPAAVPESVPDETPIEVPAIAPISVPESVPDETPIEVPAIAPISVPESVPVTTPAWLWIAVGGAGAVALGVVIGVVVALLRGPSPEPLPDPRMLNDASQRSQWERDYQAMVEMQEREYRRRAATASRAPDDVPIPIDRAPLFDESRRRQEN